MPVPMRTSMQEKFVPFCAIHRPRQPLRRKGWRGLAVFWMCHGCPSVLSAVAQKTAGRKCFQRFSCAPQVGLEPTTLRLTGKQNNCFYNRTCRFAYGYSSVSGLLHFSPWDQERHQWDCQNRSNDVVFIWLRSG